MIFSENKNFQCYENSLIAPIDLKFCIWAKLFIESPNLKSTFRWDLFEIFDTGKPTSLIFKEFRYLCSITLFASVRSGEIRFLSRLRLWDSGD